jgi:hypothetical protein
MSMNPVHLSSLSYPTATWNRDSTVPFTSSTEAARILRSCGVTYCDEAYVAQTGHQDTVMHFMLGGKSKELVIEWLKHLRHTRQTVVIDSKL